MAQAADYGLGPNIFPRGWFIVAESSELDKGPMAVRFFGQDLALYRGESGRPVLLDAYCAHMGTHLTASTSAMIVKNGLQIEGDSIRCPYHGWRYNAEGDVDDIPYFDGPCPKSASIRSYPVVDNMGCVMAWFDPDDREPDYAAPFLKEWDDPQWVNWELDHLGELSIHPQEILDNMADVRHLGPTHGAPSEYFENELKDHVCIQRQGGPMQLYDTYLYTTTWYTGPGILLSKQVFADNVIFELIANTPVDDGVVKCWHGILFRGSEGGATDADRAAAKAAQAGALEAFGADFNVWKYKRPALKIMQLKTDGPFRTNRKWYSQFYATPEGARAIQAELNGFHYTQDMATPAEANHNIDEGLPF
ncbi:MAG: Rieske (2Fe-2S) protein [Halieaceae bacterium]|nr:Rieske (2Fe-2S) protein [Halieaceae bacterium]MCP5148827.1 Rieske (2Fe-2S) protein [Pseudomonadales bacterium]MCP5165872.1 Rieske (2Fe-2S) protein [Pseudomonadales bacterium]